MPKSKTKKIQEHQQAQAHPKRLTVTDPSGWTHVTTTTRARRLYQTPSPSHPELHPAEAPKDLTLAGLQTLFARHHERWLASRSWAHVRDVLASSRANNDNDNDNNAGPVVAHLVAISLGSFSGFLRGGWVDRRTVSMDQLAALVSIRDLLKIPAYTQDPVYNALDKALLAALDIAVVEDPEAFDLVSESSFAYCPGAERAHLEAVLARMPWGLFGGPVEDMVDDGDYSDDVGRRFVDCRSSSRVPGYDPDEKAFYGMRVYLSENA